MEGKAVVITFREPGSSAGANAPGRAGANLSL